MYQNKIFCALSSIALIFFCVSFRESLPSVYLIECFILLSISIQVNFRRDNSIFDELNDHKDTLAPREKLALIDKSYSVSRFFKFKLFFIVGVNILIMVYLGLRTYKPEIIDNFLEQYPYFATLLKERMKTLTLFQNTLYNSLFFLISFPYLSSGFSVFSKVNWKYFRFLYIISFPYKYLQLLQAFLLIATSFLKYTIATYALNFFAFCTLYEISIQKPLFFRALNHPFKHRCLSQMQYIIQQSVLLILALEYAGLPEYGLNSFESLLSGLKTAYDGPYLLLLAIIYFLSLVIDVFYKVRFVRGQIFVASNLEKNFDLQLINFTTIRERERGRRQSVIILDVQATNEIKSENFEVESQIEEGSENNEVYFTIMRILFAFGQMYTVFIIMRFPYLGFTLSIFWLFQSSITRNPQSIVNWLFLVYQPTIFYLIKECLNLKIQDQCLIWILIFNNLIILKFFTHYQEIILSAMKQKQQFDLHEPDESLKIVSIIWAFILRNSYSVTLIIVFWISLFSANIIHTLLLVTTILFIVRHENQKGANSNLSFRHRNWIWMVIIINIIIIIKYVYMLEIVQFGDLGNNIIELFGFQFEYNLPFNLGFNDKDFGSLSIFWMLDFFVVLQYETYKSNTYKQLQQNYQHMITKVKIFSFIRLLYSIFYSKFIIWICYWICILILVFQSFNLINLIQIVILLYTLQMHIKFLIDQNVQYRKIQICWSILLNLVGVMTLFRYLFDFSWYFIYFKISLQLVQNQMRKIAIYEFLFQHQAVIGLSKRIPFLIFPNLVLDIAVLCLGYLGQDYLQQMNSINTKKPTQEIEMNDLSDPLLNGSENDSQIEFRSSLAFHFNYDVLILFPMLKQVCLAINNVMPIAIYIITVITSILYKISFSMLIYLLIMFSYIYKTRQYFRDQFQVHKISNKLNEKIIRWKYNFIFKVEKEGIHVRMNDEEENKKKNNSLILQIGMITKDIQQKSSEIKQACWHFTIGFSVFFVIVTYLSQVLQYCEEFIDQRTMDNIKYILFAFGTYNDYQRKDLIYKDVYPYFMALLIIIFDIKLTYLMNSFDKKSVQDQEKVQQQQQGNQQDFNKPFILRRSIENQANYLIDNFYFNKYQLLKLNFQQCAIHSLERMYMMILFFLGAISEGIFSIIYVLLFALVFYSSKNSKSMINLVSIVVVIFQYICYLITLSQGSSPRQLPEELTQSEYLIFNFSNADLLDQLGLSGKGRSKGIFVFNCIIIFAIWLFYYFQEVLSMKIIVFIDQCYINMRIRKKEDHVSSKFYIIIKRLYILCIVYFPLFIQLCVLFYYLFIAYEQTILKAINLGMFLFTMQQILLLVSLYLYLQEIQLKNPKKQTAQRIDIFNSFLIVQQCAILTIFTILFAQKLVDKNLHQSNLSIIEIFIFYLLQLGKDLLESEQYMEISNDFYFNLGNRSEAVGLAMSYEANNRKLMKLIERYKDRNDLKERVDAITEMINSYNSDQNNRQSGINFDESIDPNNPMSEPLKITIYKWLESHRNRFLFEPSFQIVHFIACQNLEVLQIAEHEIEYITNQDFGSLIFYLENFYREATKFISPTLSKDDFKRKFNLNNKGIQYPQSSEVRMIKKDWQSLKEKISEHARLNHLRREDITVDNQNIDWKRYLLVIGQFIFTFWHYICFILLIAYYFLNHGFFTIILPLLVFAYGSIEEQQPDKTMWVLSFLYLNLLCTLEKIDDIAPFLQRNSFVVFLFGENSVLFQYITIVAILIQVNIMKNIGIYNKLVNEFETIYGSILRHLFNGTQNPQEGVKRGRTQTIVRSRSQEKFYCISTALQAQRISIQMNQTYVALQRLEDDLIDYLTRIRLIKPSFFFRAFSNMKPGKDIYPFMAGVQIILSIYIFLFYDQMKSMDSPSISELLKYSQFSGHMVIALLFQILCILIDRYIMQYQPKKTEQNIIDIFFKGGKKTLNSSSDNQEIEMEEKKMKQSEQHEISQIEEPQQHEKAMVKSTPITYQINSLNGPQPIYRKARTLSYNDIKNQIDQKQVEQLALRYKYYFQVFLLLLINLYLLYQIRQSTCNVNGECQYITYNIFMILFYMLISLYFFLSAIQIKYGINDQIAQNTLMKGFKFHNFVIFKVYKMMPFLFELRTICDWAFAETSLTLFQWIKLEELHSLLYLAKCNSYFFSTKKVGQKIPFHTKFSLGFLVIIVLLGLLFGPIFLYSPLNPTFQNDNLIGANIEVGLKINKTNYFTLFVNSHVSDIHQINEFEWNSKNLTQYKFLNNIDKESLQIVKLTHFSDTYWDISYPSLYSLSENLKNVLDKKSDSTFSLVQTYRFQRQYTDLTQQFFSDDYELNQNKIQQIYNQIVSCQQEQKMLTPIPLNKFYHDFIRIDKNKDITVLDETLKNTVSIQLNCTANDQFWWSIYSDYDQSVGMKFYIVSDKYSSALLGYSILGFYITIVYVAGKMARGIMSGGVDMIMLQDMPYPDNLLKICEAIIMARIEKDLVQEELLYFQLIDIIRSPQLMRNISGTFVNQRKKRLEFDNSKKK